MLEKIKKGIRHPEKIIPFIAYRIRRLFVKKLEIDGKLYYKYKGEMYPDYLSYGNACQFIAEKALTYCKGKGIDVGADIWPLPGAIPIQDAPDTNAYNLNIFEDSSLDYVFSSHCLEHLDRWQEALSLWITKLKLDGILFLYLPHESMKLWNPWGPWVGGGHKWQPTIEVLLPFLQEHGMKIIEYNSGHDTYWSFHIVCKRIK